MHQHPRVREQEMALERARPSAQEAGPLHDDHRTFGQPPAAGPVPGRVERTPPVFRRAVWSLVLPPGGTGSVTLWRRAPWAAARRAGGRQGRRRPLLGAALHARRLRAGERRAASPQGLHGQGGPPRRRAGARLGPPGRSRHSPPAALVGGQPPSQGRPGGRPGGAPRRPLHGPRQHRAPARHAGAWAPLTARWTLRPGRDRHERHPRDPVPGQGCRGCERPAADRAALGSAH
jgi:hypothetical protein